MNTLAMVIARFLAGTQQLIFLHDKLGKNIKLAIFCEINFSYEEIKKDNYESRVLQQICLFSS